jgi:hypothetical protein
MTPPSISRRPSHGGQHAGDGGAREQGVHERPAREQHLLPGEHVAGHDVQRDRQLLEALLLHMACDQAPQGDARYEVAARAEEAEQARQRLEREDLAAAQAAPERGQVIDGLQRRSVRGDERGVHGPDRGPDEEVRADVALEQRTEHPDLDRTEAGASREHERDAHAARSDSRCRDPVRIRGWRRASAASYVAMPLRRSSVLSSLSGPAPRESAGEDAERGHAEHHLGLEGKAQHGNHRQRQHQRKHDSLVPLGRGSALVA